MTIAVWIVSGLLALMYLFAGGSKAGLPVPRLHKQFPFSEDLGVPFTRTIGVLEILGAVGLILPRLLGILPVLAGMAAVGLVIVQVGAIVVHVRRGETKQLPVNAVLLLLAAFVAVAVFLGF